MTATFQLTIDYFPDILGKNASGLMQRIIGKTKTSLTADSQLSNASACNFFLQTASDDLVRQFESELKAALQEIKLRQASGKSDTFGFDLFFSLESESGEEELAITDMKSAALFEMLCAKAKKHQINGVDNYGVKLFLNAMREAFRKSKFLGSELTSILPHAIRALDSELVKVYEKLDGLAI